MSGTFRTTFATILGARRKKAPAGAGAGLGRNRLPRGGLRGVGSSQGGIGRSMNFKRASVIFGFSPITRSRGLSRISLVARSKNMILPPIFTTSVLAVALPQFVHLVLALGLLSFLVVRPPRCAMQHGHEHHGGDHPRNGLLSGPTS